MFLKISHVGRIPHEYWENGSEHIYNNLSAKQSLWGNAYLDLKCVLQVTLCSLKYPFTLPEVIYPNDCFLPLCLVLLLCPLCMFSIVISPSDHFSLDCAWIFPLHSANYSLSKSCDASSPAVNNFLLNPRAYSLEKGLTPLECKIHVPDYISGLWDFLFRPRICRRQERSKTAYICLLIWFLIKPCEIHGKITYRAILFGALSLRNIDKMCFIKSLSMTFSPNPRSCHT